MKRKLLSLTLCIVMALSMLTICVLPASAAGQPLMLMTSHFFSIVEGDVGTLEFTIFPEYKNEKYHVAIYNENGELEGNAESTYYNSSKLSRTVNITIDTADLEMKPGKYKVEYYLSFYTFYEWHDEATVNTGYFTVVPNTCKGQHSFDEGNVWFEGDCDTKSEALFTCNVCGYTKSEETDFVHSWNSGTVKKEATCVAAGETEYICTECEETKTEIIAQKPHAWGTGAVTTAATAAKAGVKTFVCSDCGTTKTESIPAIFKDVKNGAFYETAVDWAVENEVTTGTSATTFSPNSDCTRGQIVTFLWRAAGAPKATTTETPFTDIKEGSYYYDAVIWAVENGITSGTTATTFSPNSTCTRGQIVTFLWRAKGQQKATIANPFKDTTGGAYYTEAMLWAVENGITTGTSATTFSPNNACTRGQCVTFLYRSFF